MKQIVAHTDSICFGQALQLGCSFQKDFDVEKVIKLAVQQMKSQGNENFLAVDPTLSGVYIDGDVRAMTAIKNKLGETLIIVAKNNDAVQVLKAKEK